MTSEQLITEYGRTKQADVFAELMRRFESLVISACRKVLRNSDLVEDAAQDTWLRIHQHAGTFTGASAAATWIYRVARNSATAVLRKQLFEQRRKEIVIATKREGYEADPLEGMVTAEACRYAVSALQTLSADTRRVIELTTVWEQLETEAAAALGIPVGTVKSRKHRGMSRLRKILLAA